MTDHEKQITGLDTKLFDHIECQLTPDDRRSLLSLQVATREAVGDYSYLEIGSYMGGSIQPHWVDPRCTQIYSIDKRPGISKDARGDDSDYTGSSTQKMLDNLKGIDPGGESKIRCFDEDAKSVDPGAITPQPRLCFIDAEHTDEAVLSDLAFCRSVCHPQAAIYFHDSNIVYQGIMAVLDQLQSEKVEFTAYLLPSTVFVIEFGGCGLHQHPALQTMIRDNYRGFLYAMRFNSYYREFYNKPVFQAARSIKERVLGSGKK